MQRRDFLKSSAIAGLGLALPGCKLVPNAGTKADVAFPLIISTWRHGVPANKAALRSLEAGGSVLDAVEQGVMVTEADAEVTSVGLGGRPNRAGIVELDAAVMEGTHLEAGSVAGMQEILHAVSVARLVMEKTPHVMLVGTGAREFAIANGHEPQDLLTDSARREWTRHMSKGRDAQPQDNHDTIGMVAIDKDGHVAVSCTTSGMAWKLPGRVGDSPLIGHGLYCDDKVGGAVATGVGEEVIKVCGSYQVVEFMRQGRSPQESVEAVIRRMLARNPDNASHTTAFVAARRDGQVGHGATSDRFQAAISRRDRHELIDSPRVQ